MGCKIVLVWFLLAVYDMTSATLTLQGEWKQYSGWEVTCSWDMKNDTLNAVRLMRNAHQYFIFRPDQHGTEYSWATATPDYEIRIDCSITHDKHKGKCTTTLTLSARSAANEEIYECETSGEHPMFQLDIKRYNAYVPPSVAEVKRVPSNGPSPRITLHCTSSAIPPPELVWTIEGRMIPAEFTRRKWNSTTKLWQETSTINLESEDLASKAICTPVVTTQDNKIN
ncbi:uncharacterized protein LOC113239665 isoform X2 [Hyposmocoma kahamanoa]|uniref:uncharacterized protein LOC113239665 isoform X2 n=1 Tax=Hyposmocoma kahamanoa TaxID=1477025 RepID=UPI000E6DA49D|nr:uncharacterized protein LOC113239665 isoform X2 [Hyposmocoma kahamanoa]